MLRYLTMSDECISTTYLRKPRCKFWTVGRLLKHSSMNSSSPSVFWLYLRVNCEHIIYYNPYAQKSMRIVFSELKHEKYSLKYLNA